jgi:molybdate transport system ATP-binding protein
VILADIEAERGKFALKVQFESDARLVGLFGPSGSGKTTLIHLIAGLVRPTRGRIEIDGQTLFDSGRNIDVPARRRRVGLVYQDSLLFPHLSVRQNVGFGHFFTPKPERRIPYRSVLEILGIGTLLDRRPGTLSGGERQRVALARALLASPRILLLDEPLASLDFDRKVEIMNLIERLRDEFRIPILYVSHAIEEVSRLAGHVVVLRDGRVAGAGPAADALSQSNRVVIRATDVAVATSRPSDLSVRTILCGTIAAIQSASGALCLVEVALAGGGRLAASLTRLAVSELALAEGTRVYALIKAVAIDERPFPSR